MVANGWKCILNCVSWFDFFIFNFNSLRNEYAVQGQSYTVLLKSNSMLCLIIGITFGNYFLTVSNDGADHLRLYFVYFLNYPPMYEEID